MNSGAPSGPLTAAAGRDHYPQQFAFFAGAGITGGKAIGSTDATGANTVDPGWSRAAQHQARRYRGHHLLRDGDQLDDGPVRRSAWTRVLLRAKLGSGHLWADQRTLAVACFSFYCVPLAYAQTEPLPSAPTDVKPGSITYDEIAYPYPVSYLPLTLYGQDVRMAYMDVPPAGTPNGRTVVLFHGMNFGGFYFGGPIEVLRKAGFRVVVPDQIGFGRSSKPIIPYNFNDMAANVRKLLASLGINRAAIVGHSMGGMLAARFAATNADITERVVLYDPIGLTDIRYDRPWRTADEAYKATMAQRTTSSIRRFYATIRRYFPRRHLEARV